MKKLVLIALVAFTLTACGCASIGKSLLRSALGIEKKEDTYESRRRKERRLKEERKWIKYWCNNPEVNPAMTETYKDGDR